MGRNGANGRDGLPRREPRCHAGGRAARETGAHPREPSRIAGQCQPAIRAVRAAGGAYTRVTSSREAP